jgi:pre-mRNA-processing factor 6
VSKLFWAERKSQKCREWLMRTVKLDPDLGDAWINFYKFESMHGSKEQQEDIVKRCVNAEPKHGELWCKYAKNIKHWREKSEFVLKLAAKELEPPN